MSLELMPVTMVNACKFVGEHHRHNLPPKFGMFSVGVGEDGHLVGVAIAGRPIARMLCQPGVLEIVRTCTDGTRNANSMLYGAIARAAKALGYQTLYTYTLVDESGASLKASGWIKDIEVQPEATWSRPSRPRYQVDLFGDERRPSGPKIRWKKVL